MSSDTRFTAMYERHRTAVLAYCVRRTNRGDAEDVAAEVFAIAWRRIDEVPIDMELPWLYGVARRVLSRQYRSQGRLRRLVAKTGALAMPPVTEPDTEVVQRIEYQQVRRALDRLRSDDREILLLAAWEGLSNAEIGAAVGCSAAAAAQRLHRARKRLAAGVHRRHRDDQQRTPVTAEGGEAT